jgi:hypothetical protein
MKFFSGTGICRNAAMQLSFKTDVQNDKGAR